MMFGGPYTPVTAFLPFN